MSATQAELPPNMNEMPPQAVLMQMMTGYWVSQLIYVATKLGIADLLKDKDMTSEELAAATDADARTLYRVLRALASVGIFAEVENRRFTMTPLAAVLQSGPGSMRGMIIHLGEPPSWRAWGELLYSVQTGQTAFPHANGMEIFDYYRQHPESSEPFNEAMTNFSGIVTQAIVKAYDFSAVGKLVDVGSGHASLLTSILKANPQMRGVAFDVEKAIEGARERIQAEGLTERCEAVAGDFFSAVPEGGDAYIMKHIIHDWDDERAIKILKNCHRAMKDDGRLLLAEFVIESGNKPSLGKLMDINMLVLPGGLERTADEYRALFAAAGFRLTRIIPTESPVSIIEGTK